MKINKKGIQLNEAFGAVLTIILVALLVIVSIVIFTNLNTATVIPLTAATSINESTPINAFPHGLDALGKNTGMCGAVTAIYNGTGGISIGLGNFSQGSFTSRGDNCILYNETSLAQWGATLLVNYPYTYTAETSASNASTSMSTNFSGYPALIGLVGTIIFLALVIGVLVASFAFGGRKGV